jgi:hypothetical protein
MNTNLLMTSSAIVMGITGLGLSFMPHELLHFLNPGNPSALDGLVLQVLGALYFAFAMINWTAKANLIGGIYGRPIAIGNLSHFIIGSLALVKGYSTGQNFVVLIATGVYVVFGILFTIVFFRHPVKENTVLNS